MHKDYFAEADTLAVPLTDFLHTQSKSKRGLIVSATKINTFRNQLCSDSHSTTGPGHTDTAKQPAATPLPTSCVHFRKINHS